MSSGAVAGGDGSSTTKTPAPGARMGRPHAPGPSASRPTERSSPAASSAASSLIGRAGPRGTRETGPFGPPCGARGERRTGSQRGAVSCPSWRLPPILAPAAARQSPSHLVRPAGACADGSCRSRWRRSSSLPRDSDWRRSGCWPPGPRQGRRTRRLQAPKRQHQRLLRRPRRPRHRLRPRHHPRLPIRRRFRLRRLRIARTSSRPSSRRGSIGTAESSASRACP